MQAFLCSNGMLTRCDAPVAAGAPLTVIEQLGFVIGELDADQPEQARCLVCRPRGGHDLFLAVHGMERQIHALVLWRHAGETTWIFVATPFDLVIAVEYVARYARAMRELCARALHPPLEPA